ncbi:hypothetical protein QY97_03694 [Bacillus thermotolerans]|uniref:Uncharacterized protein n=1 Tax=Bacillus thermotolerans TaxID=1221996 RepID=A0A0F5HWN1_BACTR|nr:hypothetical protein QY95_03462 [Bacillus thermotolerans]KKB37789.1 hypothetical protein QY97_03694 [Bacillus thermotolerans]
MLSDEGVGFYTCVVLGNVRPRQKETQLSPREEMSWVSSLYSSNDL